MRFILVFSLLITSLTVFAQFGIRAGYGSTSFKDWEGFAYRRIDVNKASFLNSGLNVGVDYWFRLKKRRIEFMPELGYTQFAASSVDGYNYSLSSFNAYLNVHVYLLDLAEDCNCPTFSKQGNTIKKGFFIHAAPFFRYYIQEAEGSQSLSGNSTGIGIRAGAGIDIGLSDFLTLTPMVAYEATGKSNWKDLSTLDTNITDPDIKSSGNGLFGLMRLGFRPNSNKRRR